MHGLFPFPDSALENHVLEALETFHPVPTTYGYPYVDELIKASLT